MKLLARNNPALEPLITPWAMAAAAWVAATPEREIALELITESSATPFQGLSFGCGSGRRQATDAGGRAWQWVAGHKAQIVEILEGKMPDAIDATAWSILFSEVWNTFYECHCAWMSLPESSGEHKTVVSRVNAVLQTAFGDCGCLCGRWLSVMAERRYHAVEACRQASANRRQNGTLPEMDREWRLSVEKARRAVRAEQLALVA